MLCKSYRKNSLWIMNAMFLLNMQWHVAGGKIAQRTEWNMQRNPTQSQLFNVSLCNLIGGIILQFSCCVRPQNTKNQDPWGSYCTVVPPGNQTPQGAFLMLLLAVNEDLV